MIFFIAALLIAATVATVFINIADDFSSDLEDEAERMRQEVRSHLAIINDPGNVPYENSTGKVTYYLMNIGTGDLSMDDIVVSANGTASGGSSIAVRLIGGGTVWSPGGVVEVNFTSSGLVEGVDYHGFASTAGMTPGGKVSGHSQDVIIFRIRGR